LRFGGLQKNSLIDYPGKISCVIFVSGCNFDCPYCHNPDLVAESPSHYSEEHILEFLEHQRGWLDGVVISGGEPTLQKDIVLFCKKVRTMAYPVKLDTNGSKPHVLESLIAAGLLDYISMDIKTDPYHYAPIITKKCNPDTILSSIRTIMDSEIPYEFRTTCVKPLIDERIMDKITRLIQGATRYILQRFQKDVVLHPEFFKQNDYKIDEEELMRLRSIAEARVEECIVR